MRKRYVIISKKEMEKGNYKPKRVLASNYKEASRKLGITPYEMRTYGHIEKVV